MKDPLEQPSEVCPDCKGVLTRVRSRFMCLSLERDCDYTSLRRTPMRIFRPGMLEDYNRKHAIPESFVMSVYDYVMEHPWCSIPDIAGAMVCDRALVREALKYRDAFGVRKVRTLPRSPYRYAHNSVVTEPDVARDRIATALPWKPVRRWEQDEDRVAP